MTYVLARPQRDDDLVCEFLVEPRGCTLAEAADAIAAESSIGTWTDVAAMRPDIAERLAPTVTEVDESTGRICVAGNIFGMKQIANLRLVDIDLPLTYIESFAGPGCGLDGVRERLGIQGRPLVGTIIKPKVGLGPAEHAAVAFDAWSGGCDVVKDDENLTDQQFSRFPDRLRASLAALAHAEDQTGERKLYLPNVSAEGGEMIRRAHLAASLGSRAVMVDLLTVGWSAAQTLCQEAAALGLAVHAHRAFHAAFTRNPRHGVTMLVVAKLARLAGADLLHVGTGVGKMEGPQEEVRELADALRTNTGWGDLLPVFPVASGGLHALHVPALVANLGIDVVIQAGGGVHGHPGGTRAGASAMRQAVDAAVEGVPITDYARDHRELAQALEAWV